MHKKLQEISKFLTGLIAADFIFGLWLYHSHLLPRVFLGIPITPGAAVWGMVFDLVLIAFLVHFAWMTSSRERTSAEKIFHNFAGVIFTLVALLHLSRFLFGWNFILGSWIVPYWINGLGTLAAIFLAYASLHLGRRSNRA